jgi:glutaredoxin
VNQLPAEIGLAQCALRWLTHPRAPVYSNVATEIKLYSREWCSWCIDAKEYLTERGFSFSEIDVGQDRDAYKEMTELSDQTYVPTLVAGDEVLANFDTDQLEKFLADHNITP